MINDITPFTFHINTPNNEDVEPLLYENWLAVADGMGGSGCMKHEVDRRYRRDLYDILQYVLPEYNLHKRHDSNFSEFKKLIGEDKGKPLYLNRIFQACIDNEINTSARWASRIVMTRFLYYLIATKVDGEFDLDNPKHLEDLEQFITAGLINTKNELRLTVDSKDKSILPTTFAALHYLELSESECVVYAVWAGDSRCYLLDGRGLRKLSVDDENENKQLTNNFCADNPAELHCKKYILQKPFTLICASDGFFDAYDKYNLVVEAKLLEDIFASGSTVDLQNALIARYTNNLADDTSVAFVPVGFNDFEQFKGLLQKQYASVSALFAKHKEYSSVVSLIDKPEHQVTASICDRFEMKFGEIIRRIVDVFYNDQQDILLTFWWKEIIKQKDIECRNELQGTLEKRRAEAELKLLEGVRAREYSDCFKKRIGINGALVSVLEAYRVAADRLSKAKHRNENIEREISKLSEDKLNILDQIWSEEKNLISLLGDSLKNSTELNGENKSLYGENENRITLSYKLNLLNRIESMVYRANTLPDQESGYYKQLVKRIRSFKDKAKEIALKNKNAEDECRYAQKNYESAFNRLRGYAQYLMKYRQDIFTAEFLKEMDVGNALIGKISDDDIRNCVAGALSEKYANDSAMISRTLQVFKENPKSISCIDELFPAGKLSDFRKYYIYKNGSIVFDAYKDELNAYEEGVDSLLMIEDPSADRRSGNEQEGHGETMALGQVVDVGDTFTESEDLHVSPPNSNLEVTNADQHSVADGDSVDDAVVQDVAQNDVTKKSDESDD